MHSSLRPFVHCLPLLLALPAFALTPAELITPELAAERVTLTGMHDDELSFFDADRRLRREPAAGYVRLRLDPADPTDDEAAATAEALLSLTDGQRLAGAWKSTEDEGQTLLWSHPAFGDLRFPLDAIAVVRFTSRDDAVTAGATQDRIVLSNGDALFGFVPALGDLAEGVPIEHEGQRVVVPRERVRAIVLANPPVDPPAVAGRHLVRFRDGSRVLARDLSITADLVRLTPSFGGGHGSVELPLDAVESIDFVGAGWQLIDLADQPMEVRDGGAVFGLPVPPTWEAGALRLHAPVTVAFTLPDGALRVSATAELDLAAAPRDLRDWADLLVTLGAPTDAGTPGTPQRLAATQPAARLDAPATGSELLLVVDAGVNGPILDRARLRDAVILVRRPVAESADGSAGGP